MPGEFGRASSAGDGKGLIRGVPPQIRCWAGISTQDAIDRMEADGALFPGQLEMVTNGHDEDGGDANVEALRCQGIPAGLRARSRAVWMTSPRNRVDVLL
jgi:hypothetical protein